MTALMNYDVQVGKQKLAISERTLAKLLQNRNKSEMLLKNTLRNNFKIDSDTRNEILQSIYQYTTRAPLTAVIWNKYSVKKCIEDSIFSDEQFNPYKVKEAFRLVEEMLVTLVQLPWHKEFRKIFTYSGHFRQYVSGPLNSIEEVLKSAGFQPSADCPMHLILPSVRMPQVDDGECVASTLFDCLIAQAICCEIIDVFEDCCRRVKVLAMDNYCDYINCFPWIKRYYRMRGEYDCDTAVNNLNDLFCDFANHLSQIDLLLLGERNMEAMDQVDANSSNNQSPTKNRKTTQPQQNFNDKPNIRSIPDDLLRLPSQYQSEQRTTNKRRVTESTQTNQTSTSKNLEQIHGPKTSPVQMNGYGNDIISKNKNLQRNNSQTSSIGSATNAPYYHNHQLIEVDVPQSDRELLIPKYERKRAQLYHRNLINVQPNSLTNSKKSAANNYSSNDHFNIHNNIKGSDDYHGRSYSPINNLGSSSTSLVNYRRYFQHEQDPYHHQSTGLNHQDSSHQDQQQAKYVSQYQSHKKYDSRDIDLISDSVADNGLTWICDNCSYGNNPSFLVLCQVCRRRK